MSDVMYCTESEVIDNLLKVSKTVDEAPHIFVAYREQPHNALKRKTTFVVQTNVGNEALINALIKESIKPEVDFKFIKSEVDIQGGNLTVDYLFIEATITPKLN